MTNNAPHILIGKRGESEGVQYLKSLEYHVLETNYRTYFGEIDCIAKQKEVLVFIEIKTRTSHQFGLPQEAVSHAKQRKIVQSAKAYLQSKSYNQSNFPPIRFDVLAVTINEKDQLTFELIQDAIELS